MPSGMVEADADLPLLLIAGEGWHKGVVGLVASRLTERFRRPSCVIAWEEKAGSGTGSLRSIARRRYRRGGAGGRGSRPPRSRAAATPWRPA